jgi:hypothetical protein
MTVAAGAGILNCNLLFYEIFGECSCIAGMTACQESSSTRVKSLDILVIALTLLALTAYS